MKSGLSTDEAASDAVSSGKIEDTAVYNAKKDNEAKAHAAKLAKEAASIGERGRGLTKEEQKDKRSAKLTRKKAAEQQEDIENAFAKLENLKGERRL